MNLEDRQGVQRGLRQLSQRLGNVCRLWHWVALPPRAVLASFDAVLERSAEARATEMLGVKFLGRKAVALLADGPGVLQSPLPEAGSQRRLPLDAGPLGRPVLAVDTREILSQPLELTWARLL